jgi:3-oxoadipate enol-lactonase
MAYVQVDGCEIHFEVTGSGPPVVLLHGLASCLEDWGSQVVALSARHTVVAIDLRGHGKSDKPPGPYRMAMFARDVTRVLETLGLGPAHVVGLSLGGMVAFQLAVDAPSLVRTLVILNSAPEVVPRTVREWLSLRSRLWILRVLGIRRFGQRIAAINFPDPGQEALRHALAARIAANDVVAYRETMRAIIGWSVADRIGAISCPTLVVTGDHDYTPVALKENYAKRMRNARVVVIDHSRHVTPVDRPTEFNRALLDFLAAHEEPLAQHEPRVAASG